MPSPELLNGVGVVAVVLIVGWMLITGKGLATQRELKACREESVWWREMAFELSRQAGTMIHEQTPAAIEALADIGSAVKKDQT